MKRCRFEDIGIGLFTNYSGSSNFYIADNYFIGRDDPDHVIGWAGDFWAPFDGIDGQKFPPVMASYMAVKMYGPGHVIAYNYVANFHDGIDIETYGNPDGSAAVDGPKYPPKEYWDRRPVSIDFYNNYMTNFHDNPFETDGSMHNVRVMRNMMINSASHAFCNQPAIGGPVYWIRNIAYHLPGGSTRLTGGSAGVLFYNNTILSETQARARRTFTGATTCFSARTRRPRFSASTRTRTTPRRITTASARIPVRRLRSRGTRRSACRRLQRPRRAGGRGRRGTRWSATGRRSGRRWWRAGRGGANAALETRQFATLAEYSQRQARISTASSSTTTCS